MRPDGSPLIIEQPQTTGAIAALIDRRLGASEFPFGAPGADPLREALVRIGARYCEILTEHLNAVPELHHQAFVSLLGGIPAPALPAQVLLAFKPVASRAPLETAIVVPGHTPVVAPPAAGDTEPVGFETLADLTVVRAEPVRALAVDPQRMVWADVGDMLLPPGFSGPDLFVAATPIELALYIAAPAAFGVPQLSRVSVEVEVRSSGLRAPGTLIEWGICAKDGFVPLNVESDATLQLSRSGVIVLTPPAKWPLHAVNGNESQWLMCRMVHSAPAASLPADMVFEPALIGRLRIRVSAQARSEPVAAVCFGTLPLDPSKDFFPFGERPRFGDVFHMLAPVFAQPGARVDLSIQMTNPAGLTTAPMPPVDPKGKPRLKWEIHTSQGWTTLDVDDGTKALTQDGEISFTVPPDVAVLAIAGQSGPWVRARLASGHYGAAQIVDGLQYPVAPSIASLLVHSKVELGPVAPQQLVRCGILEFTSINVEAAPFFAPFAVPDVAGPALYVALASQESSLRGRTLSFQVQPGAPMGRVIWRDRDPRQDRASPRWQLRTADGWRDCAVADESAGLTRSGVVKLHVADTPSTWPGSSVDPKQQLLWLRIVWPASADAPRLRRLVLNAVRARQTLRLENEVLGSSTGRPGQTFSALRTPIVGDILLQVRETSPGIDGAGGNEPSIWIRWKCVLDFSDSDTHSRDFTLDRRSGRVGFGDGTHGRIPPAGANNIRLREYHAGGGRRGNQPAGVVAQLRTTVPYIESVTHWESASGGQDGGDAQAVQRAASAWLRHRDRAVGTHDYVDLAHAASPEVARAYCYSTCDLSAQRREFAFAPGVVSVVVVPHGDQPRPQPALELLGRVKAYLDARRPLTTELVALGPDYVGVSVRAQIACAPEHSQHDVAAECRRRLEAFLHPVIGGNDGRGWAPGERPHRSDLVALLGATDGVDHVGELRLQTDEAGQGALAGETFLVCAGVVEVRA